MNFSWIKSIHLNEATKESVKFWANIATSLSALAAIVTVFLTVRELNIRDRRERTSDWQRSLVYSIVRERPGVTYNDIKDRYLAAAMQFGYEELPREAVQDAALQRVLLSMIESHALGLDERGAYRAEYRSTANDTIMKMFMHDLRQREVFTKARADVLTLLERENGVYTLQSLWVRLRETDPNLDFGVVVNVVNDLRTAQLVHRNAAGLLFSTNDGA